MGEPLGFVGLLQNWNTFCKYVQSSSLGGGVGNYNSTLLTPPGGHRWLVLNAYCHHNDAGNNRNLTWGWRDETESPASFFWMGETIRAADEHHCVHSHDGDCADPNVWLGLPICEGNRVLVARGHGIANDKRLYIEAVVLKGRLDE